MKYILLILFGAWLLYATFEFGRGYGWLQNACEHHEIEFSNWTLHCAFETETGRTYGSWPLILTLEKVLFLDAVRY